MQSYIPKENARAREGVQRIFCQFLSALSVFNILAKMNESVSAVLGLNVGSKSARQASLSLSKVEYLLNSYKISSRVQLSRFLVTGLCAVWFFIVIETLY